MGSWEVVMGEGEEVRRARSFCCTKVGFVVCCIPVAPLPATKFRKVHFSAHLPSLISVARS